MANRIVIDPIDKPAGIYHYVKGQLIKLPSVMFNKTPILDKELWKNDIMVIEEKKE